ncbi:MAG: hypothetical protein DCC59_13845 [Chloroflexi bacterium]|nr:hypothetical protein [Chloroflexi bacterium CFX1]MCK6569300.1 hypothetical protein [Anaerolineales bacterium]MCQ3954539.1 hypothetical protein [Chloroflexota bacterium]NUQ60776.1 hypothetical protein [Anaerolineales bacterium]RIK50151.1 MAG: hypothetical protein DCC59_13845 [Chloroflexota bacterium]
MKRLLAGIFILLLAACGPSAPASPTADLPALIPPTPTPVSESASTEDAPQPSGEEAPPFTPICIDSAPTQADIDRALSITGGLFETGDWDRTYTVASDKVLVSWYSESIPSIVNLEALVFPCGYEDLDLDIYFNEEGWEIIFGNYQGYEYVNECRDDRGLRLYNFIAVDQGVPYEVRYWVLSDTPTRVISLMVVMPGEAAELDEIAYALFPQLEFCP